VWRKTGGQVLAVVGRQGDRETATATRNGADEHGKRVEVDGVEEQRDEGRFLRGLGKIGAEMKTEFEPVEKQRDFVEMGIIQKAADALQASVHGLAWLRTSPREIRERQVLAFQKCGDKLGKIDVLGLTPGGGELLDKAQNLRVR